MSDRKLPAAGDKRFVVGYNEGDEIVLIPVEKVCQQSTIMLSHSDQEALDWIAKRNQMKSRSAAIRALANAYCLACPDLPRGLGLRLKALRASLATLPLIPPDK